LTKLNYPDKAVASFFKPTSQKPPDQVIWKIFKESLITARYEPSNGPLSNVPQTLNGSTDSQSIKIAAFDLDDTLITANSGNKWARHANSWKWWDGSVPARLKQLYSDGYIVIIMSNQGNVIPKADSKSLANLKACITSVLQQLDLPIHFYAATIQDRYRKPRTGMWQKFLDDLQLYDTIDMDNSFYVGDAGGREKTETTPKDHSNCDR
jgi:bifunctional polynucleotide phosphatase/kinase